MAKRKIKSNTDQRPFIILYHDFLESNVLDNNYQKLVFVYLKKFADSRNQCFPSVKTLAKLTKISISRVKLTLTELEQKGVIKKENRTRPDGGKSSNLYTLYDYKELWNASDGGEVISDIDEIEEKRMIEALIAKGYYVGKEKEPDKTVPTKEAVMPSTESNRISNNNCIPDCKKSQDQERFTLDQIKQLYNYDAMLCDHPYLQQDIDSVIAILHSTMNTAKATIRVDGEDKPAIMVIGKLMKLNKESIVYAIQKYSEQTDRIHNPTAYLLTMLFHAREQHNLDIKNQVAHDRAMVDT